MTDQPTRPYVAPPVIEAIPLELRQRRQWVCWALEWRGGRLTKVPYTPGTTKHARANAPSTWRSLDEAHQCYLENANFFAGIGYEFLKDDPYVGVDFDHCIDEEGVISEFARQYLPQTYAEVSQSGRGIKAICKATIEAGRKTPHVELYSERRFFAMTGNALPGFPRSIREDQPAIDRLLEALGTPALKEGKPGGGGRSAHAAAIPPEEWEAGRQERRTNINRLLARLRASAISKKTKKPDTQLGYLLKEDYRGFHERWPYVGLVRADGSIDNSQIRACMASSIKGRAFTFPQFVALMSYFFGAECVTKWGTKQGVQEEFATLWFLGRSPRVDEYVAEEPKPAPRGRAGERTGLLERAYDTLVSFKAGTEAILTVADLASALGVHRRTASGLLSDLAADNRITYRQAGQYGGIVVSFTGVIYSKIGRANTPDSSAENNTNGLYPITAKNGIDHTSGVIYENGEADETPAPSEDETITEEKSISAEAQALSYIYITSTVYLPAESIIPEISLSDAVALAFDELPKSRALESTGELKRWPVSMQRVEEFINQNYPGRWPAPAVRYWIDRIRKRRRAQPFEELKGLKREVLEKKAAAARKRIARAEGLSKTAPMPELRAWYASQARQLEGGVALLAWELGRRDCADEARIAQEGYSQGEQAEMLEIVEREYKPAPPPTKASSVSLPSADVSGMVARLKARKEETQL